jgi:hypothetical protein
MVPSDLAASEEGAVEVGGEVRFAPESQPIGIRALTKRGGTRTMQSLFIARLRTER